MVAVRLGVAFDQVAVFICQYFPQVEKIAVLFQRNGCQLIVDLAQAVAVQALMAGLLAYFRSRFSPAWFACALTSGRTGVMDCT